MKLTDANGGAPQHSYDNKNRLLTRIDPLLKNETYQYDGNDNTVKVTDRKIRKAQRSIFKRGAKILTISGAAEGYLRRSRMLKRSNVVC